MVGLVLLAGASELFFLLHTLRTYLLLLLLAFPSCTRLYYVIIVRIHIFRSSEVLTFPFFRLALYNVGL